MDDIEYEIEVEQDDTRVRGNASAWGEPADSEYADEIIERLNGGDVWAWCCVRVWAVQGHRRAASHWLGGCCYRDEEDFREPGGYFDDMCDEARQELAKQPLGFNVD